MEHHANIVPWHMAAQRTGAFIRVLPIADDGTLRLDLLGSLLSERTRVVSVTHVSNVLGTVNPVQSIAAAARAAGALMVVDGAQAAPFLDVDVQQLGCDFYVFSSHKVYGPTGAGVVWGRAAVLADLPPWQGGGEMIDQVGFDHVTYNDPPYRFEAGTPPISQVIGMAAALDYVDGLGKPAIRAWEHELLTRATQELLALPGVRVIGTAPQKSGVLSFVVDGIAPMDVGMVLDQLGVAVRVGQHCAQPLLRRLGLHATVRASFGAYSTHDDVSRLVAGVAEACEILG